MLRESHIYNSILGIDRYKFSWYILGIFITFWKQRLFCLEMVHTLPGPNEISAFPNQWIICVAPLVTVFNPNCCRSWCLAPNSPEHQPLCCCCKRQIGTFLVEILHRIYCMCHLSVGRGVGAARMTPDGWSCLLASHSPSLCPLRCGDALRQHRIWKI